MREHVPAMDGFSSPLIDEKDVVPSNTDKEEIYDMCKSHATRNARQFVEALKSLAKKRQSYFESSLLRMVCEKYSEHFNSSFHNQFQSSDMVLNNSYIKEKDALITVGKNNLIHQPLVSSLALENHKESIIKEDTQSLSDHGNDVLSNSHCKFNGSYMNGSKPSETARLRHHSYDSSISVSDFKESGKDQRHSSHNKHRRNSIRKFANGRSSKHKNEQKQSGNSTTFPGSSNKFMTVFNSFNSLCKGTLNKQHKVCVT